MQFNDKYGLKDLFMNQELKGLFPQFGAEDNLQNVYSFEWVERRVADYIKRVFGGSIQGSEIIIHGKFKAKFKEISAMRQLLEDMFNNMPAIAKNIRKNTRLITPFHCISQLKEIQSTEKKIMAMQIILDNLNYNPDFQSQDRFSSPILQNDFTRRQNIWLKSVGYYQKRSSR